MTQRHVVEDRNTSVPAVARPTPESLQLVAPIGGAALRFAVSLRSPQGRELFRKQFAAQSDADAFAAATAELCPDYKVAWVDRMEGLAWERVGSSVFVTASPRSEKVTQS
jgi:hypothetical protein